MGAVDFGSLNVCPTDNIVAPCSQTQTLHFALDLIVSASVTTRGVTQGTNGLDYTVTADTCSGNLGAGSSCTLALTFAPQAAGLRTGAAQAIGSSVVEDIAPPVGPSHPRTSRSRVHASPLDQPAGTELSTVLLHGIGLAPIGVFNTAPIVPYPYTPLSGNYLFGLTVAANGDLYVTDVGNCIIQKVSAGTTTTIAGSMCNAPSGDGGLATAATLSSPLRTVLDGAGNLYLVDYFARSVREINSLSGIITTIAGNGSGGNTGDGGPATLATLQAPIAVALDTSGDLYIADGQSSVVRRVDAATGIISTFAGNGSSGYSGDGAAATSAQLNFPDALAVDSGGIVYIADDSNNVIRKVAGGVITTLAGTGTAGYSGDGGLATSATLNDPEGLAVDAFGNVYISDSANFLVRKVDVTTGIITTVAGTFNNGVETYTGDGGEAIQAGLSYTEDVAIDPNGLIYIADSDNHAVREVITPVGLATFATVARGSSSAPQDVAFSNEGTAPLLVTGLQATSDFSLAGADTTCTSSQTLAPNAACILGIELVPIANGALNGAIEIMDNFGNDPAAGQDVFLQGTGTNAAPTRLAFAAPISPIVAGGNLGILAVDVEGSSGAVVTGATNPVTLTITGPGGYSQVVMAVAVNGVASFNLSALALSTPGAYTLTATSTGLTLAQAAAAVSANAGAPAQLAFPPTTPTAILAGGNLGIVPVDIENTSGVIVGGANNPVTLTITGPRGYSQVVMAVAVNGVASFNLSALALSMPGVYTLTATSSGLAQAQAAITVSATVAAPARLSIPSTVTTMISVGAGPGIVPVDIENVSGTVVAGATNSVTLTITGPGGYSHVVTAAAANGIATFDLTSLTLTTPGTYTLTATSAGLGQAQATITVTTESATTPVQLSIASPVPAMIASGGNLGIVTVDIDNSSGTVLPNADNSVTLTISGPNGYSQTVTVVAVNGVAAFDLSSLALTSPGSYILTAASGSLREAFATVTVTIDFTIVVTTSTPAADGPIKPGNSAGFSFTLAPASGSFAEPITLTATGVPAGATYSFSPVMVTPGSISAATMLTIQTARGVAVNGHNDDGRYTLAGWGTVSLGLLLLPLSGSRRMRRVFRRTPLLSIVLLLLALGIAGLTGCGAGGLFGQPQRSYTITVTGTSELISHSATVTLTVQ